MIAQIITLYLAFGCLWTLWLEHYTVNELEEPLNTPWSNRERFFHIFIWIGSFSVFVYTIIQEFFRDNE